MEVTSTAGQAIRDLAAQYMTIERRPVNDLSARKSSASSQLAGYRDVASKLSALRRVIQDFAAPGSLSALRTMKTNLPDDAPFTATAGSSADAARYDIQVRQLATRHTLASSAFAKDGTDLVQSASLGGSNLEFSIEANGETKVISVTIAPDAKDGTVLRDTVSALRKAGFSASVVSIGGGQERLLLEAAESGSASRITAVTDGTGSLMSRLGLAGAETADSAIQATVRAGADAQVDLNGLEISSTTNLLTDVLPGLTLDLRKAGTDSFVLDVTRDSEAAVTRATELVNAFNAALDQLYSLTRPADEEGNGRGILAGTIGLGSLRSSLRSILGDVFETESGAKTLSQIGITMNREGRLALDKADFTKIFEENPDAAEELFNGESGLAVRLETFLDGYLRSGGVLDQQETAVQSRIDLFSRRITTMEEGLAAREQAMITRFAQMQSAIGILNQQSTSLESYFNSTFG